MSTIAILGGTGYAGGHITAEALSRSHQVIAVSRNAPDSPTDGVETRTGSIEDLALLDGLFADADVVIVATHAVQDDKPQLLALVPELLARAAAHQTRLGVVGGAGSLLVAPGGPRLVDTPDFPEEYKPEASSHADVLEALRAADTDADWFYVSPAAMFGAWIEGERTGAYRIGGDVMLTGPDGQCRIGGADFAIAFLDEIETPTHHGERFSLAY